MAQNEDPIQQARRENPLLTEWEKNSQTARVSLTWHGRESPETARKEKLSHSTEKESPKNSKERKSLKENPIN
jgi:hypothetical protein